MLNFSLDISSFSLTLSTNYCLSVYFQCDTNEENLTEYRLGYEFLDDQTVESTETLTEHRQLLYETSTKFAHFLMTTHAKQNDPFSSGLDRIIDEEEFICQKHDQSILNRQLVDALKVLKNEYVQVFEKSSYDVVNQTLSTIYKLIASVNEIPMIKKQTDAIKAYQQHIVTSNERNIAISYEQRIDNQATRF